MPLVRVNDITMYYEAHGEGEPLALIPGLANDVSDWPGIIAGLAKSNRVIALDNRGAGRSDKPDVPYSIEMMADDVAGLLSAAGVERAHVLGISMGGRIALALALRHPERVRSLILVSTGPRVPRPDWRRRLLLDILPKISRLRGSPKYPQPYYAFRRQREASRSYDCTERLREIRMPTLILHGRNDRSAPYELAEEMHAGIANSQLLAFPGGHIFFVFRPQQLLDAVSTFVRAV